jgi:hypothetical protein
MKGLEPVGIAPPRAIAVELQIRPGLSDVFGNLGDATNHRYRQNRVANATREWPADGDKRPGIVNVSTRHDQRSHARATGFEGKADSKRSLRAFQPVTNGLRAHSKIASACLAILSCTKPLSCCVHLAAESQKMFRLIYLARPTDFQSSDHEQDHEPTQRYSR